jgi:hypothetical protein
MAYHRLHRFFEFGIERVIGQVIGVEVGFDGLEIRQVVITLVPFFVLWNSEFSLITIVQLLLQLNHVSGRL